MCSRPIREARAQHALAILNGHSRSLSFRGLGSKPPIRTFLEIFALALREIRLRQSKLGSCAAACVNSLGLGMFLSYQSAPYRKANKIRYVLEEFETEPVPVQVVYPHTRRLSATVRAFVDECVKKLRQVRLD